MRTTTCECGCGCATKRARRFLQGHNAHARFVAQNTSPEFRARKWKGGRHKHDQGYVLVYVGRNHPMAKSNGYAYEHRLAMSEAIGRVLKPEEVVHHINGVRDDNRLENLILFESHEAHARHHAELERAAA
jgi:hypothetical protein